MRLVHKNVPVNQTIPISGHKIDNPLQSPAIIWGMWRIHKKLLCEQPFSQGLWFELSQYGIQVNGTLPNVQPEASWWNIGTSEIPPRQTIQTHSCRPDSGSDCYNRQSLVRWYKLCSKFHFNLCLHVLTCSSTTWRRDLFHWIENCYAIICSSISIQICFLFII